MLTRTAFLAAHMMCLPSAVQVLHLTKTSSSLSVNMFFTLIVFHSLADDAWKICIHEGTRKNTSESMSVQKKHCSFKASVNTNLCTVYVK